MRTLISHRILWILPVLFLWCTTLSAQGRINFSAFAGAGITISTPQGPTGLNFNSKRSVVFPNTPEKISIRRGHQDDEEYSVIYRIEAAEGFYLLVEVSAPTALRISEDTDPDNQIPFALTMAYENKGANTVNQARANSIEVPPGLSSLIIPVLPRSTGTPGPPPDPFSGDFSSRPMQNVYLFLYGEVGPIGNVKSGNYSGDIVINVTYAGSNYE